MRSDYSIAELAAVFELSRSGYYAWRQRRKQPGPRARQNQVLLAHIRALQREHQGRYGSPRMTWALRQAGQKCSRKRVARLMKLHGLRARPKRPFRPRTTQPGGSAAANLLARRPPPTAPDQVWVADITYVRTREGWLYLAAIMDLYSRKIVGWHAADHLRAELAEAALQHALRRRRPAPGLLHHSDRGHQYTSRQYRSSLVAARAVLSMSRKARCEDNAAMEAFWSTLKSECIHEREFARRQQAQRALFEYIERYYNRHRLHSALGYQTPCAYEQRHAS